jgi:8-oxo-dGTP pyrophosphatase MutT (NUDIX family)
VQQADYAGLDAAALLLQNYQPSKRLLRRWLSRAAVAIVLREGDRGLDVLMIKRAERDGDPWSGHMGFPGGRSEPGDEHALATAVRETVEEIDLDLDRDGRPLGRLSDLMTRPGRRGGSMVITPFVFATDLEAPQFRCNEEVDEVLWVPLGFLGDHSNRERMSWKTGGIPIDIPCYFYRGRRIWGLSLMMLDELMDLLL